MTGCRGIRDGRARLLTWAVLLLAALRAVVPAGMMLAPGDEGGIRVTLCSAQGTRVMLFDPETGAYSEAGDHDGDAELASDPCPFAVAAVTLAADLPAYLDDDAPAASAVAPAPARAPPAYAIVPPLPARGPPLFA